MNKETVVLGGGCFWCIEAVYDKVPGILSAVSGYAGGKTVNPSYEQVCAGGTGHAEVVKVEFDPSVISLQEVFALFFRAHDPTTLNRQGADIGTQYRSIILYNAPEQKTAAEEAVKQARRKYSEPLVTEIKSLDSFFVAEEYHQHYYEKNPKGGYCRFVIRPKLTKLGLE